MAAKKTAKEPEETIHIYRNLQTGATLETVCPCSGGDWVEDTKKAEPAAGEGE